MLSTCALQGVLLTADETVSLAADNVSSSHNAVNMSVCHNGTANHDDNDIESTTVSRVRLVQFEKNTTDPLVSCLCFVLHRFNKTVVNITCIRINSIFALQPLPLKYFYNYATC